MLSNPFLFLNLGGGEIVTVVLVFLMFFGAKNIPEIARTLGKGMRELRDATDGVQREIQKGTKEIKDTTSVSEFTDEFKGSSKN